MLKDDEGTKINTLLEHLPVEPSSTPKRSVHFAENPYRLTTAPAFQLPYTVNNRHWPRPEVEQFASHGETFALKNGVVPDFAASKDDNVQYRL